MSGSSFTSIFRIPELRQRLLFTMGALIIYRIGTTIPIPGINVNALKSYFLLQEASSRIGITDYLDFFAGGAFSRFSIFMLGILPYISMSIIMQLLLLVIPQLKKISEEEGGRKRIQRITRYGTVVVCLVQAITVVFYADSIPDAITLSRGLYALISVLSVTTGTVFLMWLGEQITQRGIGNGISLIIFAGIVARMPNAFWILFQDIQSGDLNPIFVIVVFAMFVAVVALVVYEQRGQRKIPIHYAKRVVGRKMYGAQNTYVPFKINPSGVIPVIFASTILTLPLQVTQNLASGVRWLQNLSIVFRPDGALYLALYTLLIIFFAYFYTQVSLNPTEISRNIRENGGAIPGIRPERMEEYFSRILNRIILPGALFLAFIAIIPSIVQQIFRFPPQLAFLLGGTSLLIMVGVDLDLMSQIDGFLRMHQHEGLTARGKIQARNL